jgi:hypothetical protein
MRQASIVEGCGGCHDWLKHNSHPMGDKTIDPRNKNVTVSCLSCHRSHATSAPNAGRWDFNILGMAADGVISGSYKIPNPYDGGQRSLCNKCHSKDEFDHPEDFTPVPTP